MTMVHEFITIKQAHRYQRDYHNQIPNQKENKEKQFLSIVCNHACIYTKLNC